MTINQSPVAQAQAAWSWRMSSLKRPPALRGDLIDFIDGGSVERTARPVWLQERRASATQPVGPNRGPAQSVARLSRPPQRRHENLLERMLCGRHVRGGEKRGQCMGTIKRGEGTKLMVLADGAGAPPGICMEKASLTEITLLERTLNAVNVTKRWGCRRIPRRQHNRVATHQDGRKLRRYKRRWIIERTNSWLQNFRRLVVRYERSVLNFEVCILFSLSF